MAILKKGNEAALNFSKQNTRNATTAAENINNINRMYTSNIVCNGCVNPNHVYDLFGKYNGKTAVEVRMSLLQYIGNNMGFFERRGTVCLKSRGISFPTWIENIGDETVYCDELALLGLCALYNRHCLVVTQNKFWSTLETLNPIGLMTLLQRCNVKLLFLGQL